jgi:hypothetical protein
MAPKKLIIKLCHCIKSVKKSVMPRGKQTKESAAIGICVASVLQRRGRTLKKFSCKRQELSTRKRQELSTRKRQELTTKKKSK